MTIPLIDPPLQSTTLADGRRLTWQEFGAAGGKPAVYFHGGGMYSLEAGLFHREAVERGIRLLCPNRPGANGSDVCPGRPVAGYSKDLGEWLDGLGVDTFTCLGESNGGMVTMAIASTMAARVLGGIPMNPTVPWFDLMARRVSPGAVAWGYRLMKWAPRLMTSLAAKGRAHAHKASLTPRPPGDFHPRDLVGPPPGTEDDVAALQWRLNAEADALGGLVPELKWATSDWGFDYYDIPVPLDFYCGVYDSQAPFALVLADRNPNARFHAFSYGHSAFSHPDARRRIFDTLLAYG